MSVGILFAAPLMGYAQTVTAVWDPNSPNDLVLNYQVCVGTASLSCNFRNVTVPANETSYTFVPNPGVLYLIAIRAVNGVGAGAYSAEVPVSTPALTTLVNRTSGVNTAIAPVTLTANDPDGSPLQFTHTGLPFGLTLNQSTGVISGTPTSVGTFNVTIYVTDGLATASASFVWTIQAASSDTSASSNTSNQGSSADTTAPSLSITSHANGQTVTTSNITLIGTATDSGTGGSGVSNVLVNGSAAPGSNVSGNNIANWSFALTLVPGSNSIHLVANDGAGNARTVTITIVYSTALSLTLTSNVVSPQVSGTPITFAATAAGGGTSSYQFKWWLFDGSTWTMLRDWGSATYTWTPNAPNANYRVGIWARDVTTAVDSNQFNLSIAYPITGAAATGSFTGSFTGSLTLGLTSNVSGPQVAGTPVTFTASATGGSGSYQFKWWLWDGATWTMVRDWSNATYTWTPTQSNPNYRVGIWGRDAWSTADSNQFNLSIPFAVNPVTAPGVLIPGLTSNVPSPQAVGTPVTFTASATGGSGSYEFKWWLWDGFTWTMVRDWGSATYTWTPTWANANYRVGIWARESSTIADSNQYNLSVPFAIGSAGALSLNVTTNVPLPQRAGTSITFTASASGGTGSYQFKWWLWDGANWTLLRDWGSATYTWTPATANAQYFVSIWARDSSTTANSNQFNLSVPVPIVW